MTQLFVDHIVLFVSDLGRSTRFYTKFLGTPLHKDRESVSYQVGKTKIFLALPYRRPKRKFDKEDLGLNHLAFGVTTMAELRAMQARLARSKIKNSAIQTDKYGKKPFIWFDDPDGIRLEFYLR